MGNFINAVRFLTTLPIPSNYEFTLDTVGKSAGWFPFIGLIIGLLSAGFNFIIMRFIPPLLSALLTTMFWIILTGGLHLDGTADSCDGLLNASDKERRLEIMKYPRLSILGVLGFSQLFYLN